MTIIIFIIILGVLVFVHELGHFIFAKRAGIRVDEFSLGFPPRLISKKVGETLYSLNIIPFGGYVRIFGETPDQESIAGPDHKRSFVNKNRGLQAAVLFAGILFNLLFAWLLVSISLMVGLPSQIDSNSSANASDIHTVIVDVLPNSPASKAGIEPGDSVSYLSSGNQKIDLPTSEQISGFISQHSSREITVGIDRLGKVQQIQVKPESGVIGSTPGIGINMATLGTIHYGLFSSIYEGGKLTWNLVKATAQGIGQFLFSFIRLKAQLSDVAGPVGIAGMVGQAQKLGLSYLLTFTALISINLAIINLIPFPALDGGRILVVGLEALIRRRISPKLQNYVNGIGLALLLILMVIVTYHDIARLL